MGYRENGIKWYRFIVGGEGGHCACASLNGVTFPVEEAEAGTNLPPLHPNCLCTIVADFEKSMFPARKAEPLPSNIKFQEWARKYGETK